MSEFFKKYEQYLSENNFSANDILVYKNKYPTIVVLTFNIDEATVAEVDIAGPLTCPVPADGDPVAPFIQCLISQGFDLMAYTQGGIGNNFITYTFFN